MATQDYTPSAADSQYPSYTGFTTQDPRALTLSQAAALKPLIYGVQYNQIMCELLKHQELISAFTGYPWIVTASDAYTVSVGFSTGTRFYVTPATAIDPTVTLPPAASLTAGTTLTLIPGPTYIPTIYTDPADSFYYVSLSGLNMLLNPYNAITLVSDGVSQWIVVGGIPDEIY